MGRMVDIANAVLPPRPEWAEGRRPAWILTVRVANPMCVRINFVGWHLPAEWENPGELPE